MRVAEYPAGEDGHAGEPVVAVAAIHHVVGERELTCLELPAAHHQVEELLHRPGFVLDLAGAAVKSDILRVFVVGPGNDHAAVPCAIASRRATRRSISASGRVSSHSLTVVRRMSRTYFWSSKFVARCMVQKLSQI